MKRVVILTGTGRWRRGAIRSLAQQTTSGPARAGEPSNDTAVTVHVGVNTGSTLTLGFNKASRRAAPVVIKS